VPGPDFWLELRPTAPVEALRRIAPAIARASAYVLAERDLPNTAPGWALFEIFDPSLGAETIGSMRAQDLADGGSQLFVTIGARRDDAAVSGLNRAAVALYCGLLVRGLLAPPPPLSIPDPPLRPDDP